MSVLMWWSFAGSASTRWAIFCTGVWIVVSVVSGGGISDSVSGVTGGGLWWVCCGEGCGCVVVGVLVYVS